jgi:hypothetical protein
LISYPTQGIGSKISSPPAGGETVEDAKKRLHECDVEELVDVVLSGQHPKMRERCKDQGRSHDPVAL